MDWKWGKKLAEKFQWGQYFTSSMPSSMKVTSSKYYIVHDRFLKVLIYLRQNELIRFNFKLFISLYSASYLYHFEGI